MNELKPAAATVGLIQNKIVKSNRRRYASCTYDVTMSNSCVMVTRTRMPGSFICAAVVVPATNKWRMRPFSSTRYIFSSYICNDDSNQTPPCSLRPNCTQLNRCCPPHLILLLSTVPNQNSKSLIDNISVCAARRTS